MGGPGELLVVGPGLAAAIAVALLAAAGICLAARLGHAAGVLRAGVRAVVQLGAVSLIIASVVSSGPLTLCFVAVMLAVASVTAGRRITASRTGAWAAVSIAVPVLPVLAVLVAVGLVPRTGLALIPLAGILIGGALTATVLAGRRVTEELRSRRGEVEAALSLGLLPRDAAIEIARPAAAAALLPALDQTRTVGLVTLPGAFVGMLLGGATPFEAGAVQVFVLVALLLVESAAIVITLELIARAVLTPDEPAIPR
ncbi:ABC transporter permease [Nocardiopsis trehalosi]|jgi:putative ABC transport system permease protein|uniref:ABC transporter permease n=1 Tax=Nocardiopsis trehalosi TaxID=109329 RepID=UPI000830256C|nr:ABC transporter permease [Nocardiopsis trehalosi]